MHRQNNEKITKTIIVEITKGILTYPDVFKYIESLGVDTKSEDFNAIELFEGNTDAIRCDGNLFWFFEEIINDVRYILTSDDANNDEITMFNDFFGNETYKHFDLSHDEADMIYESNKDAILYTVGQYQHLWTRIEK